MSERALWPKDLFIKFDEDPGPGVLVPQTFLDTELDILDEFVTEERRLSSSGPLQGKLKINLNISAKSGGPMGAKMHGMSSDEGALILHRLRPFVLQNERTFFPSVCNILKRRIDHNGLASSLKKSSRVFLGEECRGIDIFDGEDRVNRERRLQEWLNAEHYHRGEKEKEIVGRLRKTYPGDFIDSAFWFMIVTKINCIKILSSNIQYLKSGPV